MREEPIKALQKKVERLERSNRLMTLGAAVAVGLAVWSCGAGTSERLAARRIDVIDEKGQVRATLSADARGGLLLLDDSTGKTKVSLAAGTDRSGLELFGGVEEPLAAVTTEPGGTSVALADNKGKRRVSLGYFEDMGWLAFFDGNDNPTYTIPPEKNR